MAEVRLPEDKLSASFLFMFAARCPHGRWLVAAAVLVAPVVATTLVVVLVEAHDERVCPCHCSVPVEQVAVVGVPVEPRSVGVHTYAVFLS